MTASHPDSHPTPPAKNEGGAHQSRLPLYLSGGLLAGVVAVYFLVPAAGDFMREGWQVFTSNDQERIQGWVQQLGFWGPLAIVAAMVAQMFLFVIPSPLLMLVSVLAYGSWWGGLLSVAAVAVAASLGYWLGKALGAVTIDRLVGHETEQKIEGYVRDYGLWAVIIARISPFLSNDAISFVAGLTRMGYWKFMSATLLGITPLAALVAYLGRNADRLKTGLIWVSAVSLVAFGAYVWYDRSRKKSA